MLVRTVWQLSQPLHHLSDEKLKCMAKKSVHAKTNIFSHYFIPQIAKFSVKSGIIETCFPMCMRLITVILVKGGNS